MADSRRITVNPQDYGLDSSASPQTNLDALNTAVQAIREAGGGEIIIPPHVYNVASPLVIDNLGAGVGITIRGINPASTLAFTGSGDNGIQINADFIEVSGFRVVASAMPNVHNGSLMYLRNSSALGGSFQNIIVEKMRFEGRDNAKPSFFLAICNPAHARVRDVSIVSFYNGSFPTESTGIYAFGEAAPNGGACGDWSIEAVTIVGVGTGILLDEGDSQGRPTIEGTSFTDCVIIGVQVGLHVVGHGYLVPGHSWKGGHINAQAVCAQFDNISQFTMSDVLLYLDAGGAGKQGHVLFNNCSQMEVHNCRLIHLAITGDTGAGMYGIAFANGTSNSRARDNDGIGFPGGSAVIFNQSGGNNRAGGNGRFGPGLLLAGTGLIDLGGNHQF
jgi:hypothetical protein